MRAAWYDRPGPAGDVFVIGDMPRPCPEAGEVLVHIKASGINPSDYKHRGNFAGNGIATRMVPHSDGAGIIEQVGADVPKSWLGKRVWLWNAVFRHGYAPPGPREAGTAAEYVALPLQNVAVLPNNVSFEIGACLGVPGFTAYAAVYADGDPRGKTIFIQGGAGAVGELAVQLASSAGATVVATVSSAQKAERARTSGAHYVIDYREQDVVKVMSDIFPSGVDQIIEVDFSANIEMDVKLLKHYGLIVSYSSTSNRFPSIPYYALQFKGASIKTLQIFTLPDIERNAAVKTLSAALKAGGLRPTIAKSFPLDRIAEAHTFAEQGPDGNVVLSGPGEEFI